MGPGSATLVNNLERMNKGMLYIADDELMAIQARARKLTQKINTMDRSDFDGIDALIKELFAESEDAHVNPPFYCDYDKNIYVGKNFFANYNCVILDVGKVIIGDNCQLAPNVSIYTAGHPVRPAARNTFYEYGIEVKIGDNVWIGGGSTICPGVTIGDNCVIGAGSIITKDIPAWSIAAGNPCKVIRKITQDELFKYFKDLEADPEVKQAMQKIWSDNLNSPDFPVSPY